MDHKGNGFSEIHSEPTEEDRTFRQTRVPLSSSP